MPFARQSRNGGHCQGGVLFFRDISTLPLSLVEAKVLSLIVNATEYSVPPIANVIHFVAGEFIGSPYKSSSAELDFDPWMMIQDPRNLIYRPRRPSQAQKASVKQYASGSRADVIGQMGHGYKSRLPVE